jgi:hypothetical protein
MYCRVLNLMPTDVSEVLAATNNRPMRVAARTSETTVDIQIRTGQHIPEDSELHTRLRENLKSLISLVFLLFFTSYFPILTPPLFSNSEYSWQV